MSTTTRGGDHGPGMSGAYLLELNETDDTGSVTMRKQKNSVVANILDSDNKREKDNSQIFNMTGDKFINLFRRSFLSHLRIQSCSQSIF